MLLVISLVLSGTIYAGFSMHRSDVIDQERGEVEGTATTVANSVDARLDTTVEVVELWSTNPKLREDDAGTRMHSLSKLVNRTSFSSAGVYARNGTLRSIVGSGLTDAQRDFLEGSNFSAHPFIESALDGDSHVGEPVQTLPDTSVVRIAAPIEDPNGRIIGVLSGNFDVNESALFDDVNAVGTAADCVTITANGQELFAESALNSDPITAKATVGRTGWDVTVERPRSEIARELGVATAMQVGGVLIGLLAVAIVGLWVSRTTLGRIRGLLSALADLESGNYRTDLDLGGIEEWQRISERFNSLSGTLRQRDSQLRVLNRVLRHNLRNDMNVITARAERVLADEDTSESIQTDVEQIHATATRLINTSDHARTLYDELLTNPKQAIEPVDVISIVEENVTTVNSRHPAITIDTRLPATASALGSAVLPVVVEEVIRNAIVHNDLPKTERVVTISVVAGADPVPEVQAPRETRIEIADNGPGIPMVEEALLTDQLEETSVEHGSGLGVWLVNWLVDQIGGTVSVSTGVDRGTTVTFHLPAPEQSVDESVTDGET